MTEPDNGYKLAERIIDIFFAHRNLYRRVILWGEEDITEPSETEKERSGYETYP